MGIRFIYIFFLGFALSCPPHFIDDLFDDKELISQKLILSPKSLHQIDVMTSGGLISPPKPELLYTKLNGQKVQTFQWWSRRCGQWSMIAVHNASIPKNKMKINFILLLLPYTWNSKWTSLRILWTSKWTTDSPPNWLPRPKTVKVYFFNQ